MHDCIIGTIPIFCFSYHGPHGHSELHNSTLGDARCSDTADSPGIQFVLGVMLVAANRGKPPAHLDSRWGCRQEVCVPGCVRPCMMTGCAKKGRAFSFVEGSCSAAGAVHACDSVTVGCRPAA